LRRVTRPPRPLLAVAVLLAALCVLGSAAVGRSTAAVRTVAVPLPSTPMRHRRDLGRGNLRPRRRTGVTFVIAANQTSALGHRFLDLLFRLYPGERPR
jgi:hypothetical protein